jgi:formiminotetrahydrofolate cyclodeaminase
MNDQNLKPKHFTTETARAAQKEGVETKRRKKTIAEALRIALEQPSTENPGLTQLEEIAIGAVKKMKDTKSISDVRVAADILGELEQKVQMEGEFDWHFKFGRDK